MQGNKFAIAVLSNDRIGIISNVTGTVSRLGANIDTISQTVLDGLFTLLLTAVFPEECTEEQVREAIREGGDGLDLDVNVRPYVAMQPRSKPATPYFLTITGPDRPGLFHELTRTLSGYGINIMDLYCFLRPGSAGEDFVLVSEIDVPPGRDLEQIRIDLDTLGENGAFQVRIQHEDLFLATNNLYISRREAPTRR